MKLFVLTISRCFEVTISIRVTLVDGMYYRTGTVRVGGVVFILV